MMKVSFDGIGSLVMTFMNNKTAPAALNGPVAMSGNGEVKAAPADAAIVGVCVGGDKECAAVQMRGVVTCTYTGTAPAVGYAALAAAADGKVAAKSGSREFPVLAVDTTAKTVTFVL